VLNASLQSSPGGASARDAWEALAAAERGDQLCAAWLAVLAQALVPARAALLLLRQPDGSYAPVAARPPARDLSYLAEIATEALRQRSGAVRRDELGHCRLAYPLLSALNCTAPWCWTWGRPRPRTSSVRCT
jgi:hypothetical protein